MNRWPLQRLSRVSGSLQLQMSKKQFCGIIQILKHEHVVTSGMEYSFQRNQTFLDHNMNLRHDDAKTQHKTKSILRTLSERIANGKNSKDMKFMPKKAL